MSIPITGEGAYPEDRIGEIPERSVRQVPQLQQPCSKYTKKVPGVLNFLMLSWNTCLVIRHKIIVFVAFGAEIKYEASP